MSSNNQSLVQLGRETPVPVAALGERVDLPITGMTCVACAMRIQSHLAKVPGVNSAGVNFASGRATVSYDPQTIGVPQLIEAVRSTGYDTPGAAVTGSKTEDATAHSHHSEFSDLKKKFWVAAVLSVPVLVMAMSHGRIGFLNFPGSTWLQLALTTIVVFYSGSQFYKSAWTALRHRAADMNTLVAVGTGAAYLYSSVARIPHGLLSTTSHDGGTAMIDTGHHVPV